jgi:hypothetical protein
MTWARYALVICLPVAPMHFKTAMVCFFCSMKTRVTLETPMPPSTSTIKPVKER